MLFKVKASSLGNIFQLALVSIFVLSLCVSWTLFTFKTRSTICIFEEFYNRSLKRSIFSDEKQVNSDESHRLQQPTSSGAGADESVRRILWWSTVYGEDSGFFVIGSGDGLTSLQEKCKVKCEFTTDKTLLDRSHGVMFHGWGQDLPTEVVLTDGKNATKPKDVPPRRHKNQVYIYMGLEAPPRIGTDMTAYKDCFNWTMTYRLDSDFPVTYGRFERKSPEETQSYLEYVDLVQLALNRKKIVAWMVSNCDDAPSGRNKIVRELQKHIPISIYGKCGPNKCNASVHPDCWQELGLSHKFYLSFENSLCKDYVTEKFFNALAANMVPVVYGGAHYSHQFAPGSFINVDSFPSAKALAEYLLYLDQNYEEYLKYFEWRRHYNLGMGWPLAEAYCGVCERLHKEYSHTTSIVDINYWLFKDNYKHQVCTGPTATF